MYMFPVGTYIMLEYMYAFNFHLDVAGHSRGIEKIPYPYQLNKAYYLLPGYTALASTCRDSWVESNQTVQVYRLLSAAFNYLDSYHHRAPRLHNAKS